MALVTTAIGASTFAGTRAPRTAATHASTAICPTTYGYCETVALIDPRRTASSASDAVHADDLDGTGLPRRANRVGDAERHLVVDGEEARETRMGEQDSLGGGLGGGAIVVGVDPRDHSHGRSADAPLESAQAAPSPRR